MDIPLAMDGMRAIITVLFIAPANLLLGMYTSTDA